MSKVIAALAFEVWRDTPSRPGSRVPRQALCSTAILELIAACWRQIGEGLFRRDLRIVPSGIDQVQFPCACRAKRRARPSRL